MAASQKSDGLMTEINVTPLVDVVLVLLVIMMMAATALAQKTIHVELPKARAASDSPKKPFSIAVDESGGLFVEDKRVDEDGLRTLARAAVARDTQVSAVLAADGRARHENVVHALELVRAERISSVAIVVRTESKR